MDIFVNGFRTLMFFIDNIVYSIIPVLYKLLVYLSEVNLYSGDPDDPLTTLISRVYVLLGIFMLFKVSFSLLQYLVDPNAFSDSSKGFGKLVTNTLVVIVLLVSVPSIFSYAMNLQRIIVQNNLIGQLVLGTGGSTNYSTTDAEGNVQKIDATQAEMMAKDVQFMVFGTFFSVNTDKITECTDGPIFGSAQMAKSEPCLTKLDEYFTANPDISGNGVTLDSFFLKYDGNSVIDDRNFSHFDKLLWWKVDNEYAVNYLPFISTAAGIYLVFLLISFCIDVALRAIKLAFLQMIAPIAIVSYIDPKESISDSKLRKWINECAKTYFSLFLRLATIFLVMLLISIISSKVLANNSELASGINDNEMSFWIYLFLILGAFVFAKKVPEMIENIFGIKFSGELNLNPFKNSMMATGAGMALGGLAGLHAGVRAGTAVGAPVRGALSGLMGGIAKGSHSKLENGMFGNVRNSIYKQMTGSEMAVFNPYQLMMGMRGKKHVDDVGIPLNIAREQLNAASTRLGVLEHQAAESASVLTKNGLSLDKLDATGINKTITQKRSEKSALEQQKAQHAAAKDSAQQRLKEIEDTIKRNESAIKIMAPGKEKFNLERENAQLAQEQASLNDTVSSADASINSLNEQINKDEETLLHLKKYKKAVEQENILRTQIADIQKDIDTLSEEKSQRKRFYGVEDSSKQKVHEAKTHIRNRGGKW